MGRNGMALREPEGYGTRVPSSSAQGLHARSYSTPQLPRLSSSSVTTLPSPTIRALVAAGTTSSFETPKLISLTQRQGGVTVSISAERERTNANPARPTFLHGIFFDSGNPNEWHETVLPVVRQMTFNMANTIDLHHASSMFASSELPSLYLNVTKIEFPHLYWFSGVADNRAHNPYFKMTASLPNLQQLTFTLHTAGITASRFSERYMLQLEATNPCRAKERKVMPLDEVVEKYELDALFACPRLDLVRIEFIECERTTFFTKVGNPMELLREVQSYVAQGFSRMGTNVLVELVRAG
ncbi:hypothetical protein GQ44DRAFT_776122 [Phaeosphaeriaceae sp. PMI808]|nr:hypothetical protein GQ44DRAFT_776122 [Phaeosphaeriaceae sp. PMI808]